MAYSNINSNLTSTQGNITLTEDPITGTTITGTLHANSDSLANAYSTITQGNQLNDLSDPFLTLAPSEKTDEDYSKILEDAFGKKNDYALENPVRDNALKKLESYIEQYADIESDHKLPLPETTQVTDKEKDLNDRYEDLLKSRGYDTNHPKPSPPTDSDSDVLIKTPGTPPPPDPITDEIQAEFDHETYSRLHKQYITYFSSILKKYHATHDKLLTATQTFADLKEWINNTPAKLSLTDELTSKVIDTTITELDLPTIIETLTHLSHKINFLTSTNPQHRPKHICTVCITDEIDTVIHECGHTFCGTCLKTQTKCPKCRKEPITKGKIYME